MKISRPFRWILCACLIANGCASWGPGSQNVQKPSSSDAWELREPRGGMFGLDSRARDIERNLGVH